MDLKNFLSHITEEALKEMSSSILGIVREMYIEDNIPLDEAMKKAYQITCKNISQKFPRQQNGKTFLGIVIKGKVFTDKDQMEKANKFCQEHGGKSNKFTETLCGRDFLSPPYEPIDSWEEITNYCVGISGGVGWKEDRKEGIMLFGIVYGEGIKNVIEGRSIPDNYYMQLVEEKQNEPEESYNEDIIQF